MFADPILALIGAIGVVIKTLITTTVLFFVEIVANIRIARIVVVLICFLHPILLLLHRLLSLSKHIQLSFLVSTNNPFGYHLHNPSILPILKPSSILLTPMASSIIRRAELSLMAPLPIRPIPLEAIESMELRYPSESSLTDSRELSLTASSHIDAGIALPTAMEFDVLTKMMDPIQYDPFLMRDVVFPRTVPRPTGFQRWDDLTWQGSEPGELEVKKRIPLYMIQSKVPLLGLALRNPHNFVHLSNRLAHPVTIPLNYTGEDTIIPETGQPFPWFARTFIDGFSYWNEPLASVYEGLGFAFPVQSYHDTLQIPVHHQGFEVLRHDCFVFTREFGELVFRQNPNEVIDPQVVNDFIMDPTSYDPLEGDLIRRFNDILGDYEYIYIHQSTKPLYGLVDMPTQQFWNRIIDARWRRVWKRKNPWFDDWKNLRLLADIDELRLAVKRSEERLNRAVPALRQRRLPSQRRIKEEEIRGDEVIPPPEASGAADLSASSMAPTSVVRRSLRQRRQARLSSSMPY